MNCPVCSHEMDYFRGRIVHHQTLDIPGLGERPGFTEWLPDGWECDACDFRQPYQAHLHEESLNAIS